MKPDRLYLIIALIFYIAVIAQAEDSPTAELDEVLNATFSEDVFKKYEYDPTGRRDPFKPIQISQNLKMDLVSPLEKWDLEQFSVVGILWGGKEPRAMIKDPDGKLFTVNKKTKIGKNNGQIIKIREGEIVVLESSHIDGEARHETRVLEMKK